MTRQKNKGSSSTKESLNCKSGCFREEDRKQFKKINVSLKKLIEEVNELKSELAMNKRILEETKEENQRLNDLPSSLNFKTTLFADDTLLQLSDCNIKKLEKRVNNELNKIYVWLRNNEISLNISKTNYFNASTNTNFEIKLQQNVINRVRNVNYLGVLIDDGLNWEPHIKQHSLQLSKSSAIIFLLRNFVDTETLKLLYYSLIYSRVQYGIIL